MRYDLEYRRTARTHWLFYVFTFAGGLFTTLPLLVNPATDCVAYPCPGWLRAAAITIGVLFFLSGILAIVRNWQFGSRVDFKTHELVWWEGYPPSDEKRIPLERVRTIQINDDLDSPNFKLLDEDDLAIPFSIRCAPWPYLIWAKSLAANFPHIILRQNSSVAPRLDPTVAKPNSDTPADLQ